jgi:hypothetical protein
MLLKVGQAAYGEKDRGHALLGASPAAEHIATIIVHRMDIQGTAPPGQNWAPYWSGFASGSTYVLALTAPDPKARRAGMVRSRALAIPLSAMTQLANLQPAMTYLAENFDAQPPYSDVEVETNGEAGLPNADLAAALIEDETPVVWALEDEFASALKHLWYHLWPSARAALTFRLAFSPQDISTNPAQVVTTLPALRSRWTGFRLVRADKSADSQAVAMLTGRPEGAELTRLVGKLDGSKLTVKGLGQVVAISEALSGAPSLGDAITALRLLSNLSSDPSQAQPEKERLIERAIEATLASDVDAVRMARNLHLDHVQDPSGFWAALRRWSKERLLSKDAADISTVLTDLNDGRDNVQEWGTAISKGLSDRLASADPPTATSLWSALKVVPSHLRLLFSLAPDEAALEELLIGSMPPKWSAQTETLLDQCRRLNLVQLHAAVCSSALPAKEAVRRHLSELKSTPESVSIAASRANDIDLIDLALELDDRLILGLAAQRAAADGSLLQKFDVGSERWRRLWYAAISVQPSAWSAVADPEVAMKGLLEAFLNGTLEDYTLLGVLAQTPLADQLGNPRRVELWYRLVDPVRSLILSATAESWTANFVKVGAAQRPEKPLAEVVRKDELMGPLLDRLTMTPRRGNQLFQIFDELHEWHYAEFLKQALAVVHSLDQETAEGVGRLIALRSWGDTAKWIADLALNDRPDLRPALAFCADQIDWWRRYLLDLPGQSKRNAKWRTLEEVGTQLYPWGPGHNGLWSRAGGKDSDIPNAPNGGEGWRIVVGDMENGKRRIDVPRLIATMADDYPANPTLQKMRQDRFFE